MKVDFHCHTTASDGCLSPQQVVDLALEKHIECLAMTDHDTTSGYEQVKAYAQQKGLHLVSGVEVSSQWQGRGIHIVGLNVDVAQLGLQDLLADIRQTRWLRIEAMNAKLMKKGHPCALEAVRALVGDGVAGRPHLAQVLVDRQYVPSISKAFDKFLTQGRPGYVEIDWPDLQTVVNIINNAGGLAVVAHPDQYAMTSRKLNLMLEAFVEMGGRGLEVVNTPNRTSTAIGMADRAKRYGLLASIGSDFHCPNQTWRGLGWLADLPEGVTPIYHAFEMDKLL